MMNSKNETDLEFKLKKKTQLEFKFKIVIQQ